MFSKEVPDEPHLDIRQSIMILVEYLLRLPDVKVLLAAAKRLGRGVRQGG